MAAINTYGFGDGRDVSSFWTDACPVCGKTHHLFSLANANRAYVCYAAGGGLDGGTPVETVFVPDTPAPAPVQALIAAGSVVGS
ncbi:MAG TPA: hypothetical protein VMW87_03535 [Spirochaetia bacterium]|nr:hypothetical protein [Spirochaetia bacterium]